MRNSTCWRKASGQDAFFYVCFSLLLAGISALSLTVQAKPVACGSEHFDETAVVERVHDGDTLQLVDGRKLRIIGINTPELARDNIPAEPYARQARDKLRALLGQHARVKLRLGKEKTDRYGRTLAHVFLTNGLNVSQWLLTQGYGIALTVPPNLWRWQCYRKTEQQALAIKRGLWSHQRFQITAANQLKQDTRGFRLVQGVVQRVGFSKSSIWLNLSRDFAIRIKRSDLAYFDDVDFKTLHGKRLIARGWVNYYNKQLRMRVRHPAALQIDGQS